MKLRKFNAVLSLISTVLLLGHAISLAIWMLSRGATPIAPRFIPWALTAVTALHALCCIVLMIRAHKDVPKHKSKSYPKLNAATILQRISGVLLILFTWLHVAGTVGIMQPPQIVHAIVPPLFFLVALLHVAVSASKALITLGIGNARSVRVADVAVKVICAATLIADVVGFYLFVC